MKLSREGAASLPWSSRGLSFSRKRLSDGGDWALAAGLLDLRAWAGFFAYPYN